jgi:CRP-like cAMP-binding protein
VNPLIRKLEQFAGLSDEDRRLVDEAVRDVRRLEARQDIIREGERPDEVHLLLEGWAARYKVLPGGGRAIMAYLIPGDLCDIHIALLDRMDHSIGTLSPAEVAYIPRERIEALMGRGDDLARALTWSMLVDEAILREWLVTLGHRPADKRVAHLICEMMLRSKAVGLTDDDSFDLPLTQEELADTMGITPVHMNRTLQALRRSDLITTRGKRVIVQDAERLMAFADFNPNYLHQEGGRARSARA